MGSHRWDARRSAANSIGVIGFLKTKVNFQTDPLPARKRRVTGNPDPSEVCTSFVERQNLTMRMHMRRFTRLTNAFSKKIENHAYAVALHMMYYNFVRIHQKLRVTPAMAAGVSDKLWDVADIVALIEKAESRLPTKRGSYRK